MSIQDDLDAKIREMVKANCRHFCHEADSGLNPWIKECSVCGCENPKFNPEAVSDIVMPSTLDSWRQDE